MISNNSYQKLSEPFEGFGKVWNKVIYEKKGIKDENVVILHKKQPFHRFGELIAPTTFGVMPLGVYVEFYQYFGSIKAFFLYGLLETPHIRYHTRTFFAPCIYINASGNGVKKLYGIKLDVLGYPQRGGKNHQFSEHFWEH